MNKVGLLIIIFLISHSGIVLSGETIQNMLADIQLQDREYDIEFKKYMHVKPELKLREKILHAGTPISHPGAKTVSTFQLYELLRNQKDVITINALGGETTEREVIHGGYWVNGIGGADNSNRAKLKEVLAQLADNYDTPIVIYCFSAECWVSYNAIIHANKLNYTNLYWYRGGIEAWREAGLPIQEVQKYQYNASISKKGNQEFSIPAPVSETHSFNTPESSHAAVQTGRTAYKQKDYEAALDAFTLAIELDPNSAVAFNERGSTYSKLNRQDLAIKDFKRAIALQPKGSAHFYHLGHVYYDIGEFEQAIDNYNEAIRLQPDYASFYYSRCLAYKQLEERNKAILDCRKVLELSPKHHRAREQLQQLSSNQPADTNTKIIPGFDVISKNLFYKNQHLDSVMSINFGRFSSDSENEIAIVGQNGAQLLTYAGAERTFIPFDRKGGKTVPIKIQSDDIYEFMNRGGGWQKVSLLDSKGKTKWSYPTDDNDAAANDMAAGDLNGDGELEFIVGMNARGGLRVLDENSNLINRYEARNVFSVEVLDINNDGTPEILHSDAGVGIVIRRANGEKIGVIKNTAGDFSLLQPSILYKEPVIVYLDERNNLNLIDLKGTKIKTFKLSGRGHRSAEGTVAYLKGPRAPPYFAFVRTIKATSRKSALYIFDSEGLLIYHEILPSARLAITTFKTQGQGNEKLLIGENSNVWEYSLNPKVAISAQDKHQSSPVNRNKNDSLFNIAREGRSLSREEVDELEQKLKANQDDLKLSAKLLGYYYTNGIKDLGKTETVQVRRQHILWIIKNQPASEIAALRESLLTPDAHPLADKEGYESAKSLWLKQTNDRSVNPKVLLNAANFLQFHDKELAEALLKKGESLYPQEPRWMARLGYLYAMDILGIEGLNTNGIPVSVNLNEQDGPFAQKALKEVEASSSAILIGTAGNIVMQYGHMIRVRQLSTRDYSNLAEKLLLKAHSMAPDNSIWALSLRDFFKLLYITADSQQKKEHRSKKSLAFMEKALAHVSTPKVRKYFLIDIAKTAFNAGAFSKAEIYAKELLALAKSHSEDPSYGDAVHDGNMVLGRLALRQNDVEQAKTYLLKSGRITDGGTLSSFGTNVSLAKELLERGEEETVIEYLQMCKKFWTYPRNPLDEWIKIIRSGQHPNFARNLIY